MSLFAFGPVFSLLSSIPTEQNLMERTDSGNRRESLKRNPRQPKTGFTEICKIIQIRRRRSVRRRSALPLVVWRGQKHLIISERNTRAGGDSRRSSLWVLASSRAGPFQHELWTRDASETAQQTEGQKDGDCNVDLRLFQNSYFLILKHERKQDVLNLSVGLMKTEFKVLKNA